MYESPWTTVADNRDPWDVVVLGAGPAGTMAARQLSRRSLRVLLVEKSRLPRLKVCGGCLGGAALDLLEQVGLGDLPLRCGGVTLRTIQLASGGRVAEFPVGRRIAISRQTFDDALVDEARQAGVIVCDDTHGQSSTATDRMFRQVTLHRRGAEIVVMARAVLVATGLSPSAHGATHASPRSRIGIGAIIDMLAGAAAADSLLMACGAHGYVGVAPVEGGRLDVAAAVDPRALAAARSPGSLAASILREAGLPPIIALETAAWRGTPLLTQRTRPLGGHRWLLIGDAAGYVEPFTGQGIGWALQSALSASALIAERLDHWAETADDWRRLYGRTILPNHRHCGVMTTLLRSQTLRQFAVRGLRHAPSLARPVVRRLDQPLFH